jgi:cytochrome c biogenesis protein CcmG/thiol:disulfide interchange protein DsbE
MIRLRHRRRRRSGIVVSCVLLALVGGGLYAALSESSTAVSSPLVDRTDQPAAGFSLPDLLTPGRQISLAEFHGEDLVVNFWASWCIPCQTEMPLLESADRAEHGRVSFLGIDSNDTRSAAVAFLSGVHVSYPTVSDPHGHEASAYRLFGLPTTVFISPSGRVLGRHIGQLNAATLKAALHDAFGIKGAA